MEDRRQVRLEQISYYRERAGEYDRWWLRQGRYDRGAAATQQWFDEVREVEAAFDTLPLDGAAVLELAPGTGLWTERIARRAARIEVIDASVEMIERCQERLGPLAAAVEFTVADLFEWQPTRVFDVIAFCFWISHVPDALLDRFLVTVTRALRPDGALFFVDGRPEPTSTAHDHDLPVPGSEVMLRRLDDGREFRIIKNYWSSAELAARCLRAGLAVGVRQTATYFQYAIGTRA